MSEHHSGGDAPGRVSAVLRIVNQKGLHARACARLVEVVEAHDARATVSRDGVDVPGDSIMGLLMLAAAKGDEIAVAAVGPEAQALLDALAALVDGRFGEDR